MAREINLVPDIKGEMIRTLKLRNLIFFICIIVAGASVAVVLFLAMIAGGQQAAVDGKKATLKTLSSKINSYEDLNAFLTIKDQLGNLSSISSNKRMFSRTFNILPALKPKNADTIIISELNVDLASDYPTLRFDAQANAGEEPFIDYAVLESFIKSMDYLRYDYGDYVDKEGNVIPAYCIVETGADGALLYDVDRKSNYAYWLINGEGCKTTTESSEGGTNNNYVTEEYNGQQVVRIWRTPQFNDWLATENMTLDGTISGIAHFESKCINYIGIKDATKNTTTWASSNNSCLLVPGGSTENGIKVSDSSNGRDANKELVLRFSATIVIAPEYYDFRNHHMMAIGPTGRYNVTDSYVQIQNMFGERATDCAEGDTACLNEVNKNGEK